MLHARSFCLLTFALPPLAALALPTAVHAAPAVHGREAEQVAGVKKLKGGLWHPYRRRWANERKHLPLVDVGETGGWKDLMTLMNCYQQADEASMLAVMESPIKLSSRLKEAAPES